MIHKNKHFLSCRLECECTNNTVEYEALVQGLKKAIELKVSNLKVFGDSEIVVKQIRNQIHCVSPHLKAYQNEVWDLLKCFHAFNIISIPRMKNAAADLLATSAARLVPTNNRCSIELLFRPSVPDMITNLRVFDDDQQIIECLTNEDVFKGAIIDDEKHQAEMKFDNFVPKGVRTLEKMFDLNEKFRRPANVKTHSSTL